VLICPATVEPKGLMGLFAVAVDWRAGDTLGEAVQGTGQRLLFGSDPGNGTRGGRGRPGVGGNGEKVLKDTEKKATASLGLVVVLLFALVA